ncbi:MAG TPA: prefoldin subunit alpha [Candidatus Nanoarchaeia archaeon]|nr:prefoldin subunit alpha [Candidatus Nanoarchaeia archaeon]
MTENQESAKQLQQRYMEFQLVGAQIKRVREQLQQLDQQLVDLDGVKDNLEELKTTVGGTDLFVPVSSGIFMRAKAGAMDKVVLNVGAGVAVAKSIPDAQQLISEQMEQAGKLREQMMTSLNALLDAGKQLQAELEKLVA